MVPISAGGRAGHPPAETQSLGCERGGPGCLSKPDAGPLRDNGEASFEGQSSPSILAGSSFLQHDTFLSLLSSVLLRIISSPMCWTSCLVLSCPVPLFPSPRNLPVDSTTPLLLFNVGIGGALSVAATQNETRPKFFLATMLIASHSRATHLIYHPHYSICIPLSFPLPLPLLLVSGTAAASSPEACVTINDSHQPRSFLCKSASISRMSIRSPPHGWLRGNNPPVSRPPKARHALSCIFTTTHLLDWSF